jgi:hypothetical protein
MNGSDDILVVALTREEATELFMRCLRSHDEDNAISAILLQKLAHLIDFEFRCSAVA